MSQQLLEEIRQRTADGIGHFNAICTMRSSAMVLRAKGLAFVEMYAVHEFAITTAVRIAISTVSGHGLKVLELSPGVISLLADDRLRSVRDSPPKTQWEARTNLFQWLKVATTADANDQVFPVDGSHFKLQQLSTIWILFGLTGRPVPDRRLLRLVDEIVANRNAVAHGRETPEAIGRMYSANDIRKKFRQVSRIAIHFAGKLSNHCADKDQICR